MSPALPDTIKAMITKNGPEVEIAEIPFGTRRKQELEPRCRPFHAVGLNPTDWKHAIGPWNPKKTNVVGCDSSGTVIAIGSNVTHVQPGDRVFGFVFGTSDQSNGSYAEYVRFNKSVVAKLPAYMSFAEGASFPIPHLTAVQTLFMRLELNTPSTPSTENKTVLVWGGSTAVGHHAIQLLHHSGYRVFTTASTKNHAHLLNLGADKCFDYKDSDVLSQIKAASGDEGVFVALDCACENGSNAACIDAIGKSGGRVATVLPVTDEDTTRRADVDISFSLVYTELGYALTFANAFDFPANPLDNQAAYKWNTEELPQLLQNKKIKPQKLRVMSGGLNSVIEGLQIMRDGQYSAEKLVYNVL